MLCRRIEKFEITNVLESYCGTISLKEKGMKGVYFRVEISLPRKITWNWGCHKTCHGFSTDHLNRIEKILLFKNHFCFSTRRYTMFDIL